MKISIVGLGLIGGSIAKALSRSGSHELIGFDTDEEVLLEAMSLGAVKRKGAGADLADSDVVYVCLYPKATVDFVTAHAGEFGRNTLVTDVCGVKQPVYGPLKAVSEKSGFSYIGSHPMAGKEKSGFFESDAGLFFSASYIIVGGEGMEKEARLLSSLALEMGFGRIVHAAAQSHDQMIAFTSQVPHVLACAYVMSPRCAGHKGFSAGSYRDVSRVADINSRLWSGLFLSNREALIDELDCLLDNIKKIKDLVAAGDGEGLEAALRAARDQKVKLG